MDAHLEAVAVKAEGLTDHNQRDAQLSVAHVGQQGKEIIRRLCVVWRLEGAFCLRLVLRLRFGGLVGHFAFPAFAAVRTLRPARFHSAGDILAFGAL